MNEKAAETAPEVDEQSARYQQAERHFEEALAAYEAGQLTVALQCFVQALTEFEAIEDLGYVGLCCSWLGQVCDLRDWWPEALAYYEHSLEAYQAIGDRQGEGAALSSQALIYMRMAQFQRAIELTQQALEIQREIGDRQGQEASLGNLGLIHAEMGDYQTALAYYRQSLAIAREIEDKVDEAVTLHDMAELYFHTGDWERSERYFSEALALREAIDDDVGRVHTLQSWGLLCQSMGQYGRSLNLFQQALAIGEELDVPGQTAATLNNLAMTYTLLNLNETAIELLTEALAYFESVGDKPTVGAIQLNLGVIHSSLGQMETAEQSLKKALKIHRASGHTYFLALTLAHLGSHYNRNGQPEVGLPLVEESLDLFRQMNNREGLGLVYNLAGILREAVGDHAQALASYQASLVIQDAIDDVEGLRATFYNLGRFYEDAVYRPELARRCYRRAIALLEESRAGLERSVHRLTYLRDKLPAYQRLAALEWQAEDSLAAWGTVQRMRSRHLVDALAVVPLSLPTAMPAHLRQQENQLLARLRQLLYTRFDGEVGESLALTNQIGRLEVELNTVWQEMEAVAPDYVDLRRGRPLVWTVVQRLLIN